MPWKARIERSTARLGDQLMLWKVITQKPFTSQRKSYPKSLHPTSLRSVLPQRQRNYCLFASTGIYTVLCCEAIKTRESLASSLTCSLGVTTSHIYFIIISQEPWSRGHFLQSDIEQSYYQQKKHGASFREVTFLVAVQAAMGIPVTILLSTWLAHLCFPVINW